MKHACRQGTRCARAVAARVATDWLYSGCRPHAAASASANSPQSAFTMMFSRSTLVVFGLRNRRSILSITTECLRKVAPHELEHAIHPNGTQSKPRAHRRTPPCCA